MKEYDESLTHQYDALTQEEKNALLVYKTSLGLLINELDNEPDFQGYYDRFKRIYNNPINSVLKNVVLSNINFDTLDTFINSLYQIKDILDEVTSKLVTPKEIHVYRAISSFKPISGLSKGNFISTSTSFGECLKFAVNGKNVNIYEIKIPAGSRVAICPYGVLEDKKNDRLLVTLDSDQEEIILNTNNYDFEVTRANLNQGIEYFEVTAKDKINSLIKK
jgi:hypothetical protein